MSAHHPLWLLAGLTMFNSVMLWVGLTVATIGIGTRLLTALIRRRALAIRSVGRRLLVLLAVATAVPVVLLLVLGALNLYLGIANDRAAVAVRLCETEGQRLADELALALAPPGPPDARLIAWAATPRRHAQGLTVWRRDDGRWRCVVGDATPDTAALAAWPSGPGTPPVCITGGRSYVAARLDDAGPNGGTTVALASFRGAFARELGARAGGTFVSSGREGDTLSVSRAARQLATGGSGGARMVSLFDGFANVPSVLWGGGRWARSNSVLVLRVDAWKVVGALVGQARLSWVTALPLVLMLVFALVGVRLWLRAAGLMRDLGRSITAAVAALRGGAAALEGGKLEHRIAVQGDDELWDVAGAFNRMAEGLERGRALELERERLESELALARRIQARLLPAAPPRVEGVEIAGLSEPARAVGGDYYDHLALPDGRVALVIADVSGKGVPAALLMSAFRASLMSQLDATTEPATVMARVNRFLHHSVEPGRFVTAFLAVLDPRDGRLEYCNAGHNPPYVVAADGTVTTLETGGLLLGMLEDGPYASGATTLAPGARLALFTDGVTEAQAADGSMWGDDALIALLRREAGESCDAFAKRVVAEVRRFEGDQGPSDDITLLVVRRVAGA